LPAPVAAGLQAAPVMRLPSYSRDGGAQHAARRAAYYAVPAFLFKV